MHLLGYSGVLEYAEYKEENLVLEQDDSRAALSGHDSTTISDSLETRSRRQAHQRHLQRTRSSESGVGDKRERKRRVSKSELKRQLSRQVYSVHVHVFV